MNSTVFDKLLHVLDTIDRPGSFCVSGTLPVVLPGLEVQGLGSIGLPLTAQQATKLKEVCQQAPYGKGEETLVDINVRRVWQLKPEHFALTNPDWESFVQETVHKVQEELGLQGQELKSHLYDLLLYEPGSFFLPHRDGEKLDRMVATLVLVLPSSFKGGELVVRHDGQEQIIAFTSEQNPFHIHFAAFYADCEHEVRPLMEGYRLCLVYNLTLKKGKTGLSAPRSSEFVESIRELLNEWARDDTASRLVVTLQHQYTEGGLTWDALKGVDHVKARVLLEAAQQADCQTVLALLTFHESGSAEYTGSHSRRRYGWHDRDDNPDSYEMGDIIESSLTAQHWIDPEGQKLPLGEIRINEDELLDPDGLEDVDPEVEFEGYTGNAGMTLDRWYRHAALFVWPKRNRFDIFCAAGSRQASAALDLLATKWKNASQEDAAALRADCIEFASRIIANWKGQSFSYPYGPKAEADALLPTLALLDEPTLIKGYLREVLSKDATVDPGELLITVCQTQGWETFRQELEGVFTSTTAATLERNVRLLEQICSAKPRKKQGWSDLCVALAEAVVVVLERTDDEKPADPYRSRTFDRGTLLGGLTQALLVTEQGKLLERVVTHILARPEKYPLITVQVPALVRLQPWLAKNLKKPSPALSHWLASCCKQLEGLTVEAPKPPADFRRAAPLSCKCADCAELSKFLNDPHTKEHRFRAKEDRRRHLEFCIKEKHIDLDLTTARVGTPHTLVCTKNSASYDAQRLKFQQEQEYLATLRSIVARLPK